MTEVEGGDVAVEGGRALQPLAQEGTKKRRMASRARIAIPGSYSMERRLERFFRIFLCTLKNQPYFKHQLISSNFKNHKIFTYTFF